MNLHEHFMRRCLDLAVLGAGSVSPNPMVGCVIVYKERIIGEGYTSPYGGPHAEVNAVESVLITYGVEIGETYLRESTVYVSLEPCAHFGKTPPCADMLVAYGVKKVVVGVLDVFAKVNGLGIAKLRDAGVEVVVGVLEKECLDINRRFFTRIEKFRPYVILKWAETCDGFMAPDDNSQRWISNSISKQLVHQWRSEEDAILVGTRTALVDNPHLNTRLVAGKSPKRVLIDKYLDVPVSSHLYNDDTEVIVFNAIKTDWNGKLKYIALENFDLYLAQNILYQLYLMDIQSIIIEGGAKTLSLFVHAGLWDEARVFRSQTVSWGRGIKAPKLDEARLHSKMSLHTDILDIYRNDLI